MKITQLNSKLLTSGMALAAIMGSISQASANELTFSGKLWTEFDTNLTTDNSSFAFTVDRALLSSEYLFDSSWAMNFGIYATGGSAPVVENASITRTFMDDSLEVGFQDDSYISWQNKGTGSRWVNATLTDGTYRTSRFMGANYLHKIGDDVLAFTLKNGSDDAFGAGALADKSLNASLAYKSNLNKNLDGMAYFQFQNKDENSLAVASQNAAIGFGASIAGQFNDLNLLGEFAMSKVQADGASTSFGFGVTMSYGFQEGKALYGRFFTGNDGWKASTTTKQSFEFGLLKAYSDHIDAGVLGEFANTTADTTTAHVKVRLAAKF